MFSVTKGLVTDCLLYFHDDTDKAVISPQLTKTGLFVVQSLKKDQLTTTLFHWFSLMGRSLYDWIHLA